MRAVKLGCHHKKKFRLNVRFVFMAGNPGAFCVRGKKRIPRTLAQFIPDYFETKKAVKQPLISRYRIYLRSLITLPSLASSRSGYMGEVGGGVNNFNSQVISGGSTVK